MKLHIGCGSTLIPGFINIDNSPSALLSRLPLFSLKALEKLSLIDDQQLGFARALKTQAQKKEFLYSGCLRLPFKENTIDFMYSSHMIGWYLSEEELNAFFAEMFRVLRPGGSIRISYVDFDFLLEEYRQHRSTVRFLNRIPRGIQINSFRGKLKFLFSPNRHDGIPLNGEMAIELLKQHHFTSIVRVKAGETSLRPEEVEGVDLFQRADESVYLECRKPG